jgi:hypothetical protein
MLHERTAPGSADEVSPHVSHVTAWRHARGLVAGVGLLNGLLAGCIAFVGYVSVTSDEQTFTKPFFHLPARSSVGGTWRSFVRRSKTVLRTRVPLTLTQSLVTLPCPSIRRGHTHCQQTMLLPSQRFFSASNTQVLTGYLYLLNKQDQIREKNRIRLSYYLTLIPPVAYICL